MLSLLMFIQNLLFKPAAFFKKSLYSNSDQPNYMPAIFIIFSLGQGLDRIDRQFIKYDLKGQFESIEFLNNWPLYWTFATIGGLVGGYFLYLIGGWFFNLRLKWSKGDSNIELSRHIYLYSGAISNGAILLISLLSMLVYEHPYEPFIEVPWWDISTIILLLIAIYYSVIVSYTGVKTLTNANNFRAKLWFLILPMLTYTLAYITVITLLAAYF